MGWNKSMLIDDEVEIRFNFSTPRTLYFMDIHTNNMFTKDVQVSSFKGLFCNTTCIIKPLHESSHHQLFKEAEVYFSLEGERWQEDYISYEPKQDRVSEHARIIHIDLQNRTAQHIKIRLKFQHEWILISEITFRSSKPCNYQIL